jgi:Right handed beta helix region
MGVFNQRAFATAFVLAAIGLSAAAPAATATPAPAAACHGVAVTSADAGSLAVIVASHPAATTFCLGPGQYDLTATVSPADGDKLVGSGSGAGGTELRGDTVLAGWSSSHGLFTHTGGVSRQPLVGVCAGGGTICKYPDDVFWNGGFMHRVLSPCSTANVVSGTYCIDYGTSTVFLADDPTGSVISYAAVPIAISIGTGVQLSHFAVTHFGSPAQRGAVTVGTSGMANDLAVAYNHGGGIRLTGTGPIVRNSHLFDNGQEGALGSSTGALFEDNEVDHNNALGFDASWDAGGAKFESTVNFTVHKNHIHDNTGNGLWFGVDNTGMAITGNLFDHNISQPGAGGGGDGIRLEVSCNATITSNSLLANDRHGISISNSHSITFGASGTRNTVSGNLAAPVWVVADGKTAPPEPLCHPGGGVYPATDDVVRYNSIQLPAGQLVGFDIVHGVASTGSLYVGNRYTTAGGCATLSWKPIVGHAIAFADWQAAGEDPPPAGKYS